MFRFIVYRLVQLIPVLLLVSFIVFAFMHVLPGDVIDALAGEAEAHDPAVRAALTKELGLDKPIYVQYVIWLGKIVLHGDFGKSITTRRTIGVEVFKRLPATIYLAVAAVIISLIIAVPLGTIAAIKHRTMTDYVGDHRGGARALHSPILVRHSLRAGLRPVPGLAAGVGVLQSLRRPVAGPQHLLLPASALGVRLAASTTRLTRASMLDEIRKEYVDTARSLGLPEWRVIFKYTLRNALIPTVTIAGLQFAGLLGGTVVIEAIFSWPGIGLTL